MPETIASDTKREFRRAPERLPRWSLALTAVLGILWLGVVLGAEWLAPRVAEIVNEIDLRYGLTSPPPAPPEQES